MSFVSLWNYISELPLPIISHNINCQVSTEQLTKFWVSRDFPVPNTKYFHNFPPNKIYPTPGTNFHFSLFLCGCDKSLQKLIWCDRFILSYSWSRQRKEVRIGTQGRAWRQELKKQTQRSVAYCLCFFYWCWCWWKWCLVFVYLFDWLFFPSELLSFL